MPPKKQPVKQNVKKTLKTNTGNKITSMPNKTQAIPKSVTECSFEKKQDSSHR